jgi:hypothetical protein
MEEVFNIDGLAVQQFGTCCITATRMRQGLVWRLIAFVRSAVLVSGDPHHTFLAQPTWLRRLAIPRGSRSSDRHQRRRRRRTGFLSFRPNSRRRVSRPRHHKQEKRGSGFDFCTTGGGTVKSRIVAIGGMFGRGAAVDKGSICTLSTRQQCALPRSRITEIFTVHSTLGRAGRRTANGRCALRRSVHTTVEERLSLYQVDRRCRSRVRPYAIPPLERQSSPPLSRTAIDSRCPLGINPDKSKSSPAPLKNAMENFRSMLERK